MICQNIPMSSGILISTSGSGNIAHDGTSILHISYTANLNTVTLPGKENRVKRVNSRHTRDKQ